MKKSILSLLLILASIRLVLGQEMIKLPPPRYKSNVSLEETIKNRRSIRNYKDDALNLEEVSQLLWAAQGLTHSVFDFRTAPSAGALYPLKVYLVARRVRGLAGGVYAYEVKTHSLRKVLSEDVTEALCVAALYQPYIKEAAVNIVFSAAYERTTAKYGQRGIRYVFMEVGHAAQNIYLQAEALNLGTVAIGAFDDLKVKKILSMPKEEDPLYIMPVGRR